MDAHNLATLFGPNILHKTKGSEKEFNVESAERAEESKEVIEVVKDMIDNYDKLFEVNIEYKFIYFVVVHVIRCCLYKYANLQVKYFRYSYTMSIFICNVNA
jgi:hypothetical protein